MPSLTDPRVPGRQRRSKKLSYYRQASPLEVMLGAAHWYHRRAVRATERIEEALERDDASKRDQLGTAEIRCRVYNRISRCGGIDAAYTR